LGYVDDAANSGLRWLVHVCDAPRQQAASHDDVICRLEDRVGVAHPAWLAEFQHNLRTTDGRGDPREAIARIKHRLRQQAAAEG
jgi:hypothetical protein